jgi:hypothetical protein
LPPEILRGAQANVSRRPFPRTRQRFLLVLAAYKSGRSVPPIATKNPLFHRRRQNLPAHR